MKGRKDNQFVIINLFNNIDLFSIGT
ncbi:hypothetical protein PanWU01x14_257200 [Parasponia andersonii]|uniref:Uncharacterized protein n=1 Tax=Parasponia andersonii TaxID=3476 RepID=A0A2P5B9Z0_PARAD|nr:hypothetical protein PanWU01x14_257200 [Parasponia andersonii]